MKALYLMFLITIPFVTQAQSLNGKTLLEKSIQYHDPNARWSTLKAQLSLQQDTPKKNGEKSFVKFDVRKNNLRHTKSTEDGEILRAVKNNTCTTKINGETDLAEAQIKKHRLDCSRTKMLRDYYLYLYGLPMKLKDKGTIIHEEVKEVAFMGTPCYALKVTYEKAVGEDTWYFYMDKNNYGLIGYRFYHEEAKNDGEYITLEDIANIKGIKMPKIRKWYYNKDDKYLGTDTILK